MFKWITSNLGIKVLSFFTAFLLWFHVITEKRYEKTVQAPVSCINLPENLLITKQPPEFVKVKVRGKGKEFLRFGGTPKVMLDLMETELGWRRVDLEKEDINVPYESKLEVASDPVPRSFIMRVERKVKKKVKIVPNLKSDLSQHETGREYKFKVIPEVVEISGGSSVYQVSEITTEKIVVSPEFPETLKVKLEIPEDITADEDSVIVILLPL